MKVSIYWGVMSLLTVGIDALSQGWYGWRHSTSIPISNFESKYLTHICSI